MDTNPRGRKGSGHCYCYFCPRPSTLFPLFRLKALVFLTDLVFQSIFWTFLPFLSANMPILKSKQPFWLKITTCLGVLQGVGWLVGVLFLLSLWRHFPGTGSSYKEKWCLEMALAAQSAECFWLAMGTEVMIQAPCLGCCHGSEEGNCHGMFWCLMVWLCQPGVLSEMNIAGIISISQPMGIPVCA